MGDPRGRSARSGPSRGERYSKNNSYEAIRKEMSSAWWWIGAFMLLIGAIAIAGLVVGSIGLDKARSNDHDICNLDDAIKLLEEQDTACFSCAVETLETIYNGPLVLGIDAQDEMHFASGIKTPCYECAAGGIISNFRHEIFDNSVTVEAQRCILAGSNQNTGGFYAVHDTAGANGIFLCHCSGSSPSTGEHCIEADPSPIA